MFIGSVGMMLVDFVGIYKLAGDLRDDQDPVGRCGDWTPNRRQIIARHRKPLLPSL